jgi:hypothetical protein
MNFWLKNKVTVVACPLYSLGFVLCDFFLFPKLKMMLKGRRFNDITMVQANLWYGMQLLRFKQCTTWNA